MGVSLKEVRLSTELQKTKRVSNKIIYVNGEPEIIRGKLNNKIFSYEYILNEDCRDLINIEFD